jgi:hypothetical protein
VLYSFVAVIALLDTINNNACAKKRKPQEAEQGGSTSKSQQ